MTRREDYGISLGVPTDVQLDEINKRLKNLEGKKFSSINNVRAFVPSNIEYAEFLFYFNIGREQCKFASQFLVDPKRDLVFSLVDSLQPNGYAIACGDFDAVLLTNGFIIELNAIIERLYEIFLYGDLSELTGKKNFKEDLSRHFPNNKTDSTFEIFDLVRHLALGHIIGHEFGHLASGHFGFANDGPESENQNESLASNLIDGDLINFLSQAREIEADIFAAKWIKSLLNEQLSSNRSEIISWLKSDPCRLSFIFSISSLAWYVTLGAFKFSTKDFLSLKTHPPTSFRAKLILDSALMQDVQRDPKNQIRHEGYALEALFRIALGQALKCMRDLEKNSDDVSKRMLKYLSGLSKKKLISRFIGELGLALHDDEHRIATTAYLTKIWLAWDADQRNAKLLARWKPEHRVVWGI